MSTQPSRRVTRPRCLTCGQTFTARRADARHCSGRCRQRAARARDLAPSIDAEIEAARRHYWTLVRRKAQALGAPVSRVLTDEAQLVTSDGRVFMHGTEVGHTSPARPGWDAWGLEAAGAPFNPPPMGPPRERRTKR